MRIAAPPPPSLRAASVLRCRPCGFHVAKIYRNPKLDPVKDITAIVNNTFVSTDTGNTNLMDQIMFTAVVGECVVPELGQLILLASEDGRVRTNLISSVALTNLQMTVEAPSDRLTNLWLEPLLTEIAPCAVTQLNDPFRLLNLATAANQFLIGTQQVAWLHFTTVPEQSSAFVPLRLDNIVGLQPDGTPVGNFGAQSGRLAIIGDEPLLEAVVGEDGGPLLILYGQVGTTNTLFSAPTLDPTEGWVEEGKIVLQDLFQTIDLGEPTDQTRFYRAVRE